MRKVRFSIAGLMVAVAVTAVLVAGLRSASDAWAGAMLMLVCGVFGLAIVGFVCRSGIERTWWLGFALFGCGYLVLAFWSENNSHALPTTTLLLFVSSKFDQTVQLGTLPARGVIYWSLSQIAHCVWSLLAALFGGASAALLFAGPENRLVEPDVEMPPSGGSSLIWRHGPAVIWLTGLVLVALAAVATSQTAPGLWAGVVFMLTCGMIGLAILGALVGRGRARTMWLGAAIFGFGYMLFTFGRSADSAWPYPPTTHLLNALRPGPPPHRSGFPDASERFNSLNAHLLQALEQPIAIHFPNGAPLEDILKQIKSESEARLGKPFPIYVDPVGLKVARQTMSSSVMIDVDRTSVKNCLSRTLRQCDLTFAVRDGFLMISDADAVLPAYEDPYLIVGHCLLALIAAGLGGALAPLFSSDREQRPVAHSR